MNARKKACVKLFFLSELTKTTTGKVPLYQEQSTWQVELSFITQRPIRIIIKNTMNCLRMKRVHYMKSYKRKRVEWLSYILNQFQICELFQTKLFLFVPYFKKGKKPIMLLDHQAAIVHHRPRPPTRLPRRRRWRRRRRRPYPRPPRLPYPARIWGSRATRLSWKQIRHIFFFESDFDHSNLHPLGHAVRGRPNQSYERWGYW